MNGNFPHTVKEQPSAQGFLPCMSPGLLRNIGSCSSLCLHLWISSARLCCHKAAASAKWLSAPAVFSWATLIFLSLATEDAGSDFSQLILIGIASTCTGRNWMHRECLSPWMNNCTNSKDAKATDFRLSQVAVTVNHLHEMTVLQ